MKKFLVLLNLLIITTIFNACSSTTQTTNSTNSNAQVSSNSRTSAQTSQTNTVAIAEAEKKNKEVFGNSNNQNIPTVVRNPADDKDNNYNGRPAPDNSTFKSEMNEKGQFLETRTFKDHPQLLKVEHYPAEKKILVYLKNGKTIEVPADKLPTFQATVPGTILKAAGVEVKEPPATAFKDGTKPVEQKPQN